MSRMNGSLITYNSSTRNDITKIHHFLFGRVSHIIRNGKKQKYYYPGFFENTGYKQLSNGCYFVKEINDDFDGLLKITPASITFQDDFMMSGKDYWEGKLGSDVRNWEG